jgi:hypothetical protein
VIILGVILEIVGAFVSRLLLYVGLALILVGVILLAVDRPVY